MTLIEPKKNPEYRENMHETNFSWKNPRNRVVLGPLMLEQTPNIFYMSHLIAPYMRYFEAQRWCNRYIHISKMVWQSQTVFCGDISSLKFSKQIILCCISCIRSISVMWIYLWAVFPSDNREKIVCPEVGSQFQIWK